ncbi:hypothetical protein ACFU7Y_23995 [Kitasatospora sp. NPDC057542]|uniref:hypothetical protein n=1 Tax=Kitasatospora sp. NPDC057542 TaxID=3346162 RepID=UPI003686F5B8
MAVTQPDQGSGSEPRRLRRGAVLAVVLTCLSVGIVLAYVYVGTLLAFGLGALYMVAAGVGLAKLGAPGDDPDYKDVGAGLALVFLALLIAIGAGADAWHNQVLGSGRDVKAMVVAEHVDTSIHGTTRTYDLSSNGEDVPGGPLAPNSRRFSPGDYVTVRMDPAGRVAPKLPGEADSPASLWCAIGINAGIALFLLWFAYDSGKPPRAPRPAGPWRERMRRLDGLPLTAAATAISVPWLLCFLLVQSRLGLALMVAIPYPLAGLAAFGALVRDDDRNQPQGLVLLAVGLVFTALALFL